jgi:hypothetical protein
MSTPLAEGGSIPERTGCVLHIGAPKTGSTALQRFLAQYRENLANAGFVYPGSIERGFGHHDLAFFTGGGCPEWAAPQTDSLEGLLGRLRQELDTHSSDARLILSSENFYWLSDPRSVKDMLATLGYTPDSIAVVVYIRRQEDAIASWYNQLVKALGYSASFEQSVEDYDDLWDYEFRLAQWAAAFGRQRVIVRLYTDEPEFDVCRDFAELLQIPTTGLQTAAGRANPRLVRDLLEFQRVINRLPLPTPDKRRYHKQLISLSAQAAVLGLDDTPLHTKASRCAIRERYAAGNQFVANTYFGREELFPLHAAGHDDAAPPPPLSPEKLAAIFAWLLMTQPTDTESPDEAFHPRKRQL